MFAEFRQYREVYTSADCKLLQDDPASVSLWSQRWQFSLNSAITLNKSITYRGKDVYMLYLKGQKVCSSTKT